MITVNNKLCIAIAAVATLITGAALAHAEMSGTRRDCSASPSCRA